MLPIPVSHPLVHPYPAPAPDPAPAPALPPVQGQGPAPAPPAAAAAAAQSPAQGQGNANGPPGAFRVSMRDPIGAPGTRFGLGLRLAQAFLAAAALAAVASTDEFASITAFRYLLPAAALQCLWSFALAGVDVYALLVGRSFRTLLAVGIFSVGDWITGALTLSAACASAAVTTLIRADLEYCYGKIPCPSFEAATAMAFLSWFALAPSCVLNLGAVVDNILQRP